MSKAKRAAKTRTSRGEGLLNRKRRETKARLKAAFAPSDRPAQVRPQATVLEELIDEQLRQIEAQEWKERVGER